jgi:hypothetical protein
VADQRSSTLRMNLNEIETVVTRSDSICELRERNEYRLRCRLQVIRTDRRQEGRACAQVGIQLAEGVLQRELCSEVHIDRRK